MSNRGMMVMYGGAPDPGWDRPRPETTDDRTDWQKVLQDWVPKPLSYEALTEEDAEPERLRVSATVEADGTLRLRVELDGRLIVETGGRGTVTVESEL